MASYVDWLKEFLRDKEPLDGFFESGSADVHSLRRFKDASDVLWETAFTYTGRLVVRSGRLCLDGKITWTDWQTKHDVETIG